MSFSLETDKMGLCSRCQTERDRGHKQMRLLRTPMTISRKEKRCEKSFDEYYIQAQEKGQSLGFDNQELLIPKRRVSQRLDDTPATQQHHLSGKSKYRIDFYYGTIDLMVNALEKKV